MLPSQERMKGEYGRLEGLVLHSQKLEEARSFYQDLLGIAFKEEKHEEGPKHYAGHLEAGLLLELYPPAKTKMTLSSPTAPLNFSDPGFIFNVHNLEDTLKRMEGHTKGNVQMLFHGAKIYDPDGRAIYLHKV